MNAIDTFLKEWKEEARHYYKELAKELRTATDVHAWIEEHGLAARDLARSSWNAENFEAILDKEVSKKKKHFISRIEKKAGKLISTEHLKIGKDGHINGTATGEKGTVTVTTIGAGGYNIQCFHYRVLVK